MAMAGNALIVGASRGIGLALTERLLTKGYRVTASYRQASPLTDAVPANWLALDLDNAQSVQAFVHALAGSEFDVVLINAGIYGPAAQSLMEANDEQLMQLFKTNTFAPVRLANQLLPRLRAGGVLAFTSSAMASLHENSFATMPLYSASKAALNMLVRSMLPDVEIAGSCLLSLHPGWVQTEMGGEEAPVTVQQSVEGLIHQLEKYQGLIGHYYVDYQGNTLRW